VALLDLKCYCFNALTDEGTRAVIIRLTALTSLVLWGCSKVTDERMRAVRSARAHVPEVQHAGLSREACCIPSKYVPKLL
jgi:hypothetical protein